MSESLFTVKWLEQPSEAQILRIVAVFQAAFANDDGTNAVVGGDPALIPVRFESNVRAASVGGRIQVATVGPQIEDIVGAALWFGPEEELNGSDEQKAAGGSAFFEAAPQELVPTMNQLEEQSVGVGAKKRQWYLPLLGVSPNYQGKGITKAFFKSVENLALKDGVNMILESGPDNVVIYKKLGFEVRGQTELWSPFRSFTVLIMEKKIV